LGPPDIIPSLFADHPDNGGVGLFWAVDNVVVAKFGWIHTEVRPV